MIRLFLSSFLILCLASCIVYAQPSRCPRGQGSWLNPETNAVECEPCPSVELFGNRALKLPLGCMVLRQGTYLSLERFTQLKVHEGISQDLQLRFQNLQTALSNVPTALRETRELIQAQRADREALNQQIQIQTERAERLDKSVSTYKAIAWSIGAVFLIDFSVRKFSDLL